MAKLMALKNISNRPIELVFDTGSERIAPNALGKFHTQSEWDKSFAEKQASTFISRREAKYVERNSSEIAEKDLFIKPKTIEVPKKEVQTSVEVQTSTDVKQTNTSNNKTKQKGDQ